MTIEGLNEELAGAVRSSLSLQHYVGREVTAAQVRRLFKNAEQEAKTALEPYGYYNVMVTSHLQPKEKGLNAVLQIAPGEPVRVTASQVRVEGEAAELRPVDRAVRNFRPAKGEPLNHGVYEQSKEAVESSLLNEGFLRNKAITHRVEVSRRENSASIDLLWESGPRMKFGQVHFSDSQFSPEFLERFIPWEEGDYYSPEEVLALQQRLVEADYFANVSVQPDLEHADGVNVPINVGLTKAKRSVYTAGVYLSTDTGFGARVGLQRRWLNRQGHKLQFDIDEAQRRSAVSLGYSIPLPGPNSRSFNFGVSHRDEDTDTSTSRNDRIVANETRRWRGFARTLGGVYLAGTYKIGGEDRYSRLLYAEGSLSKKEANDLFFPRRGYSLGFGLRFAPEIAISDTSFSQVTVDAKMIRTIGRRQRLLMRTSLGAMIVDDFDQLPPDLRFFAGGDLSIRGFDYQALGSTNAAGEVIGGTYLTIGSIEYERFFVEKWGGAIFLDGGDAFRATDFNLNLGAGIGVRWRSPVGMVRVDLAKPVKSDLAHSFRVHFSLGPDL